MNTNETVKHVILYISITLIIATVTFALSRAYYLAKITVADKINATTVKNANLDIEFLTSQYIKIYFNNYNKLHFILNWLYYFR